MLALSLPALAEDLELKHQGRTAVRALAPARGEVQLERRGSVWLAYLLTQGPVGPAEEGLRVQLELPEFGRGLSIYRLKRFWTSPVFTSDYRNLAGDSQLLMWQQGGRSTYHVLIPLAGSGTVSALGVRAHRFGVHSSSYVADHAPGRVPLFAYASGSDPYQVLRQAYQQALPATGGLGKLRWQKSRPALLDKLGWCSWNAFYEKVDAAKIVESARWLRQHRVPTAWILVDDGWMQVQGRRLAGLEANPVKFPGGLAALVRSLDQLGFRQVGVWHTLQGYWEGLEPGLGQQTFPSNEGMLLPDPRGTGFYQQWYAALAEAGIDFVKVDNQGGNFRFTDGLMPRWDSNRGSQQQLQRAVARHWGNAIINCMELSLENVYNWEVSNVARSSDDYLPDVPGNAAEHVLHNAYTTVWLHHFAYPDYDMFQSGGADGAYHAAARAISGGPVYCTDRPDTGDPRVLRRLALSDGSLLQPDQPALICVDRLLRDPSLEPIPLGLAGEVERPGYRAHLVGSFHVHKNQARVRGDDDAPAEGWVGYRVRQQRCVRSGEGLVLDRGGWELTGWVKPEHGLACFGLVDKYLGPAAVESARWDGRRLRVRLREGGRVGFWAARRPRQVNAAFTYAKNWLLVDLPETQRELMLEP